MEKLRFTLFSVVVLVVLGLVAYWAVATIQSGSEHATTETIERLQAENENLRREVELLKSDLRTSESKLAELTATPEDTEGEGTDPVSTEPDVYKNQSLIDELEKLISDGIFMKVGSRGTRVGTVQKFLNVYNDTSKRVDNDYGNGTKADVTAFQRAEGLTADGEAGKQTFSKMVEWLKEQG